MHALESHPGAQVHGRGEVGLGLAEADVGGQSTAGAGAAKGVGHCDVMLGAVGAAHVRQHAVAARLQREVQVRAHPRM